MLGGYQILNLTNIDLELNNEYIDIEDEDVLRQLRNLRDYIEDNYNFSRPLNNKLKTVMLRLIDKKEGEQLETCVMASLNILSAVSFSIHANLLNSRSIQINVTFEKLYDDDSNAYWDIQTAQILLTGNVQIFENIVDKDGHNRFIEGTFETTTNPNWTITYKKWSLSGSHLLIVISFQVPNGYTIENINLATIKLPKWIMDKIIPAFGKYVDTKAITVANSTWSSSQNISIYLSKEDSETLAIVPYSTPTMSTDRLGRIAFDLLIDNE